MHQEGAGKCHEGNRAESFHTHHPFGEAHVPQAPVWVGLGSTWAVSAENATSLDGLKRDFDQWKNSGRAWWRLKVALEIARLAELNLDKQKCTYAVAKIRFLEEKLTYYRVQASHCEAEAKHLILASADRKGHKSSLEQNTGTFMPNPFAQISDLKALLC